jgi:hypothetical protein
MSHGSKGNQRYVLVIHGGAGIMDRAKLTPEIQQLYHAALRKSLRAGYEVLSNGGEAMDAVVAAVSVMEGQQRLDPISLALSMLQTIHCSMLERVLCLIRPERWSMGLLEFDIMALIDPSERAGIINYVV